MDVVLTIPGLTLAAALSLSFVLMTLTFRRPIEGSTRLQRRGRKIAWD